MNQHGCAAEALGQLRGEMIDVGVILALHAAGERNDLHIEGPVGIEVLHHRADRLAAGNGDHVPVANCLEQLVGRRAPDLLQVCVRIARNGGRHHRMGKIGAGNQPVFPDPQAAGTGSR